MSDPQYMEMLQGSLEGEGGDEYPTTIDDLPDEVLENIFARLSPYQDLDSVCAVCHRWNHIAKGTIQGLKSHFLQSIQNGKLECIVQTVVSENQWNPSAWPQERFGQVACYHDKSLYIIGGSTHRKTTFNDMWKLDLGSRTWSRVICRGNYPSPKALASCVQHRDTIYMFGGWTHASSSPLMTPWRLFDELHRYSFTTNTWTYIVGTNNPPPTAGHSCTTFGDEMVMFGGRTYDLENQRYPVSNDVWVFDFNAQDWYKVAIETNKNVNTMPAPRYGQTQSQMDESHILIIGGCDGPTKIFNDVWLLTLRTDGLNRTFGSWRQLTISDPGGSSPLGLNFHYAGCRVGDSVIFFQQSSTLSPYMTFLHFDSHHLPPIYQQLTFEESRDSFHNGRRSMDPRSGAWRPATFSPTMSMYSLDISRVVFDHTVSWTTEITNWTRPEERFLHSVVAGRSEIIIFGGFFKESNGRRCRVSSDVFILRTVPKTY